MIADDKVLALKYRPQKFEDLIGQSTISQTLSLALDYNRLSHAYLFSGLRGSGKTSTARIMAKALICQEGPTSKPCNQCPHCLSCNENRHLDVIEMDAASNRGIDDIKTLIEQTKYKPSSAKFKVFIIDEVHMLTTQAFNALLKTLEEPPAFVKFILATTDPLKLPATILSRTQHFRFKKIPQKDVNHHLAYILNQEKISFEMAALEMLSRSGQGSLRDTLTLLDQAIIFSKGEITALAVSDMLGLIDPEFMDKLFQTVLQKGDIEPIMTELEEYDMQQVLDEMSLYLKERLLDKDARFDLLVFDRFFRIIADSQQLLMINCNASFVLLLTLKKFMEATSLKTIQEVISKVETVSKHNESLVKKPLSGSMALGNPQRDVDNKKDITQEQPLQEVSTAKTDKEKYTVLIQTIYNRSHELGHCFEKNFLFKQFKNNTLFIASQAQGEERKLLYKNFAIIRHFIEEIFEEGVDIEFEKLSPSSENKESILSSDTSKPLPTDSTVETMESSSAVSDGNGQPTLIEKQLQPNQVEIMLRSDMISKTKELFDIKQIVVKETLKNDS